MWGRVGARNDAGPVCTARKVDLNGLNMVHRRSGTRETLGPPAFFEQAAGKFSSAACFSTHACPTSEAKHHAQTATAGRHPTRARQRKDGHFSSRSDSVFVCFVHDSIAFEFDECVLEREKGEEEISFEEREEWGLVFGCWSVSRERKDLKKWFARAT